MKMKQKGTGNLIKGRGLKSAVSISKDLGRAVSALIDAMDKDLSKGIGEIYAGSGQAGRRGGGLVSSKGRILANALLRKYRPLFRVFAQAAVARMAGRVLKHSAATLKLSLKDMSPHLNIKLDLMDDELKEITTASVDELASLLKIIPDEYILGFRRILTDSVSKDGMGASDVFHYMSKLCRQTKRNATLNAVDYTNTLYSTVTAHRMKKAGVKQFVWRHSHGGRDPRKEHLQMDGEIFSMDKPPVIYYDKGSPVRGFPGQAKHCKCFMEPVINFGDD